MAIKVPVENTKSIYLCLFVRVRGFPVTSSVKLQSAPPNATHAATIISANIAMPPSPRGSPRYQSAPQFSQLATAHNPIACELVGHRAACSR